VRLLGDSGPAGGIELTRLAGITAKDGSYLSHKTIVNHLRQGGIAGVHELELFLNLVEEASDKWFHSHNNKQEGYRLEEAAVDVVARLGDPAVPVLKTRLASQRWSDLAAKALKKIAPHEAYGTET
jgi:hypothetical protein